MGALGLQLHRPSVQLEVPARIFSGFTEEETEHLLACTYATARNFKRGEVLVSQGADTTSLGIVLRGTVLLSDDASGQVSPVAFANAGDHFGEELGWGENPTAGFTVTAATPGSLALLDLSALQNLDGHICELRTRLSARLLELSAETIRRVTEYRQLLELESLRERLSQFFLNQQAAQGSDKLLITLTREQIAAHLGTDKSALGKELKAMQEEELIDYYRSSFRIVKDLSVR